MIDSIVFLNEPWLWPILFGAIILVIVFLWKDWAQSGKGRFILKAFLAILSVTALALIALKPALPSGVHAGKMILLTPGYLDQQVDSLKKEYRKIKILEYVPGQPLTKNLGSSEKVFIAGHGVKEYDLWQMTGFPTEYLGGTESAGVVKLNYERELPVGDRMVLKGIYRNPEPGKRLVLQDPGGAGLDSIVLTSEKEQSFHFETQLKVAGNYVFSLAEKDSMGNLGSRDPLPVKVNEKKNLKILVLNSFPTFETRNLKNFLSEAGHELVVRSQMTRERFKYEYLNTEPISVGSLTEATLEGFDVVLMDAPTLRNLSGTQTNVLERLVREGGLGIFIQADESFFNFRGDLVPLNFERVQNAEIGLEDWQEIIFTRFPYRIKKEFGIQSIHTSGDQIITAYRRLGEGRIGTSVIFNTYHLNLEGKAEIYRQFWTKALEQLAVKESPPASFEQDNYLIYPNEPFHFKIRSELEEPEVTTVGHRIPLIQNLHLPWLREGTTWPQVEGWNAIRLDTTAVMDYYVAGEKTWRSLSAVKTKEANQRFFRTAESIRELENPLEPINPLWFYGLFLICMGGLWLEPKV